MGSDELTPPAVARIPQVGEFRVAFGVLGDLRELIGALLGTHVFPHVGTAPPA